MDGRPDGQTGYPTGASGPDLERPAAALTDPVDPGAGELRAGLFAWYADRGRRLAIRETSDPWAILVAEVMSQQTRIDRVEGHWGRFIALYPTPAALAAAALRDAIRAWSGLGYNRRAVALRDAAQAIVDRHGGRVPATVAELDALPGIGPYTARAVAAIAFGEPVAAVDVNVRRVVERLAGEALAPAEAQRRADALVDPDRPGAWTHAVMDLAATVCRRREPRCADCPVARWCASGGTEGGPLRPRGAAPPFSATRRWLRGRLLAEVAQVDGWHVVEGGRGAHGPAAVREAMAGLAQDGLVEMDDEGRARIP